MYKRRLLQNYSEKECGFLIRDVRAGRLREEAESKNGKLKGRFQELLVKDGIIERGC